LIAPGLTGQRDKRSHQKKRRAADSPHDLSTDSRVILFTPVTRC
jgi:hypothetical protein